MDIDKKKLKKLIFNFVVIPIYFISTILANYIQHYEYIFTDVNNIKEYKIYSDRRTFYAEISLEPDMYVEGQYPAFEIKEAYEDKNYFIGCDFDYNYETEKIEKRYYVVVDKVKATMKIYSEKKFKEIFKNSDNIKFENVHSFLKKRGTKIAWQV